MIGFLISVCNGLLREGVSAIVNLDEKNSIASDQIKLLSESIKLPYISSYFDQKIFLNPNYTFEYSIHLHPNWQIMSRAFIDLINYVKWERFIFIYEESTGNFLRVFFLIDCLWFL